MSTQSVAQAATAVNGAHRNLVPSLTMTPPTTDTPMSKAEAERYSATLHKIQSRIDGITFSKKQANADFRRALCILCHGKGYRHLCHSQTGKAYETIEEFGQAEFGLQRRRMQYMLEAGKVEREMCSKVHNFADSNVTDAVLLVLGEIPNVADRVKTYQHTQTRTGDAHPKGTDVRKDAESLGYLSKKDKELNVFVGMAAVDPDFVQVTYQKPNGQIETIIIPVARPDVVAACHHVIAQCDPFDENAPADESEAAVPTDEQPPLVLTDAEPAQDPPAKATPASERPADIGDPLSTPDDPHSDELSDEEHSGEGRDLKDDLYLEFGALIDRADCETLPPALNVAVLDAFTRRDAARLQELSAEYAAHGSASTPQASRPPETRYGRFPLFGEAMACA